MDLVFLLHFFFLFKLFYSILTHDKLNSLYTFSCYAIISPKQYHNAKDTSIMLVFTSIESVHRYLRNTL